ncbi:amino acid adenylation domain-containing protein [Microcoleus sp. FACHB-831]|uniref:non-ribosomal peptide synthetase n=1 Tax=Microcoleus sp. FACHB-831 TaxID=2692827 RepID=UPI0016841BBE|nr:non-ribosomal peptide synthetase [Microcoleus sp. FACHB-831]MBD1924288.1 amino acid adenylation domain-containing protein [Microcoleus sp. FACHB-831]
MGKGNVEDFYPISPMQQGMLFHTIYEPNSGVYFEQLSCTIQGNLNVEFFQRAWQQVIDRHPILRTCFIWEGIKEPVQAVQRQVKLPWQQYDWQEIPTTEQQQKLEFFLQADREQGFDLKQTPPMRLTLIRLSKDSYRFIWSHHHILLDGWSNPILLKEIFDYYSAFCQGEELSLPRPRPYRDYIAWLHQQKLSQAEAFWREKLIGFGSPTTLKITQNQLSVGDTQSSYDDQEIHLSATTTTALQSLARQHQLTLNTLVQAAWALLLSRYSGENDVVFGTAVSGRPPSLIGSDAMVGLFINTLPVRVKIGASDTLLSWLKQLQAQQVDARQYEYTPLAEIQRWSEVAGGMPLFESLIVFENYPLDAAVQQINQDLQIKDVISFEKTNYPLTVMAVPGAELSLKMLYDTQRFDAATIQRILGHLQTLLAGMVAEPNQSLATLPMLTKDELHQLLVEFNQTRSTINNCTITQLFEAQVEKTPDAVAVICENQQLTYRELNQKANQLASYLQSLGVKPEVLVGVCVERSLYTIIALLGILKAGGAYVPLDPTYPQERLAFMLADAQVSVLLTKKALLEILPQHNANVVCLDTDGKAIETAPVNTNIVNLNPSSLAYVLYTSGSTGTPKGVLGLHSNTVNRLTWNPYPFSPDEICCQKTSLNFVDSVWEIFAPLIHGIPTVIIPDQTVKYPEQLVKTLSEQNVTRLVLVPSLLRVILDTFTDLDKRLPKLKYWVSSGEALSVDLVQSFYQQLPNSRLINLYGSSEVAADVTWHDTSTSEFSDFVPIGGPIANTQVYICDRNLQPVPIGVQGEIYIGGANLARGYLNRPELTAEKFITNPLTTQLNSQIEISEKLYKTGDLGCYLPNGEIKYLGRIDHQVKIRGIRIEIGEIEALINQYPAVADSVVIVREDSPGNQRLVAYVVSKTDITQEVRSFLKQHLPEYMIPAAFVQMEALPLTPNGKINRLALPASDNYRPEQESVFVAPQTQIEQEIAEIWTAVLSLDKVGIKDNFFDLGGHSLMATQLISRVKKNFGVDVSLPEFFKSPTIKDLAEIVETQILIKSNGAKIDELLDQMENLDEAEVQKLLSLTNGR